MRTKFIKFLSIAIMTLVVCSTAVLAQSSTPRLFYSDLESGPNTGGQNNNGAFVTLWGKGFGASQGTSSVTVGGGAVAAYELWSDGKIIVQLGAGATTGNIVVKVARPQAMEFHSRCGPATSFLFPPAAMTPMRAHLLRRGETIVKAKNTIAAGDVAYIENGVAQTTEENFTAYISMDNNGASNSGTAAAPKALIAYPNATVTVGVAGGLHYGIRTPNIGTREDYWVISQLHIIAGTQAMDIGGTGWKIVGNEMQCPNADDQVGCFEMSEGNQVKFWGNEVHNAGINPTSSKYYHAVYFSTDSNHIDVGWNHIHDNFTCRALAVSFITAVQPFMRSRRYHGL